jgi:5-methylcytosine-specific restriction protein B
MASSPPKHWIVGSAFKDRNEDQTSRFLREGIWEIDNPAEAERSTVQTMRTGDRIAIKSTFVQKHGLPFNTKVH